MAEPVRVRRLTDQEGQRLQEIVRRGSTNSVRYRRAMEGHHPSGETRPAVHPLVDPQTLRFPGYHPGQLIRIGCEALRCLLARRGVTFQRTKAWKESTDPERDAKLDRIDHVLENFPDRTFAFDEFGPLGIRPTGGSCWAEQGKPHRVAATYHRTHGVTYFHGCYSISDDTLWGINHRHKGPANSLTALKSIRAARPDGTPIYVILDNLSAHGNPNNQAEAA